MTGYSVNTMGLGWRPGQSGLTPIISQWAPDFGGPVYQGLDANGNAIHALPSEIERAGGARAYYNGAYLYRLGMSAFQAVPNPIVRDEGYAARFSVENGKINWSTAVYERWSLPVDPKSIVARAGPCPDCPQSGGGPGDRWKSYLPVAILLGGDLDLFVGGGGEVGAGGILILRGPDAGKFVNYLDYGVGLGLDLSLVAEGGLLFYTGDASKFTKDHLRGDRTEVSGAFLAWGGNIFWTPKDSNGERVIGVLGSYGPGINPLVFFGIPAPWTFNINYGATDLFKSKRK